MERGTTNHADRTDLFVLRISENKRPLAVASTAGLRAVLWGWKLLVERSTFLRVRVRLGLRLIPTNNFHLTTSLNSQRQGRGDRYK
jgi:hypothetical protein